MVEEGGLCLIFDLSVSVWILKSAKQTMRDVVDTHGARLYLGQVNRGYTYAHALLITAPS